MEKKHERNANERFQQVLEVIMVLEPKVASSFLDYVWSLVERSPIKRPTSIHSSHSPPRSYPTIQRWKTKAGQHHNQHYETYVHHVSKSIS